ncbi:MAG: universal stress protein [Mycolicibacterium sp.]|nr:universal stress protein [Mycolicibacterium sp.]
MSSQQAHHGILVGVDGSPDSKVAVDWAARDAHLRGLPLTIVHILPTDRAAEWLDVPIPDEYLSWRKGESHKIMAEAVDIARLATDRKVPVEEMTRSGHTVSALADLSRHATMIVVGSRGLGAVSGRLLGSVSSGLLHHAHCPVALFRNEYHPHAPVVVGIDGSPASEAAVAIAFDEASRRGVPLIAVHTYTDAIADEGFAYANWSMVVEQAEEALGERLAGWQERYPDVLVRRVVTRDWPAHQLVEQSRDAQLLVVGSHGRGGFAGLLLGSVSSAVAQSARIPVIVARGSGRTEVVSAHP